MVCKFILLFEGRTGRSYIADSLLFHKNILMFLEIFSEDHKIKSFKERQIKSVHQLKIAEKIFNLSNSKSGAVGFKTLFSDILDKKRFAELLKKNKVKIIHMIRKNTVKLVVSTINGKRLFDEEGVWNRLDRHKVLPPFNLDLAKLKRGIEHRELKEVLLKKYIKDLNLQTLKS